MAFPTSPLDLRCELNIGGTWTDISSTSNKAYQRQGTTPPVVITRGRPDESSQVNASSAAFQVNNRNGNFSPRNPLGIWYGQLGRNTPVRWSVPAQANYMRLEADNTSYASTPTSASLQITGDTDIRIDFKPSTYTASALCGKNSGGTGPSWLWTTLSTGQLRLFWWDSGSNLNSVTSTLPFPIGRTALRVTLAVATGTVTFYTAPNIGGSWTQLGAAQSGTGGAATSVFSGTAPVRVGDNSAAMNGAWYGFQLLNGIGGTVEAYANFTAQTAGATSWTDPQGNTWTLNGTAEISSRNYRYHGEMSSLPPKWDNTGTDQYVPVTAGGLLRRIGQGAAPVQSPIQRAIISQTGSLAPVAYWPCEDATGATSLGSALGGPAMTFDGNPAPVLASDTSFLASAPLLALNGTRMHGKVPAYTGSSAAVVRFLAVLNNPPGSGSQIIMRLICAGATCRELRLSWYNGGGLGLSGWDATGANVFDTGGVVVITGTTGLNLMYSIDVTPVAGGQQYAFSTVVPGASGGTFSTNVSGGVHGTITDVWVNPVGYLTNSVFGHCSVQGAESSVFALAQPLNAWIGETAGNRFTRLCGENGFQSRLYGPPGSTAAMGAQSVSTFATLIQECESADLGQVYEPRQCLGLGYRTLASMAHQAPAVTLDYSQAEIGGTSRGAALEPTYDDQFTRNDVTVTRSSGSVTGATYEYVLADGSAMSVSSPPTGVGDYATSVNANVQYDSQLPDTASWLVHTGTVNEARWPVIPVNLARPEIQNNSLYYPLADTDIGDYVQLVNLLNTVTYDPVKQLVYQVTESLGGFFHELELTGVPESPYEVMVLDDPVYGRADTDGSSLAAGVSSSATTLSVSTTGPSGILWTTNAGDFPFDIAIAGERITVTNITGASSPQSFTVTRSVNGVSKAQSSGADVRLWFPPVPSLE